ncbi:Cox15 [Acrasis kona]|uniref:Cox15 n=1 Tax=Acrasis kona TaxID=1008807 RepID=A0AAW2Z6Z2_9EUKA
MLRAFSRASVQARNRVLTSSVRSPIFIQSANKVFRSTLTTTPIEVIEQEFKSSEESKTNSKERCRAEKQVRVWLVTMAGMVITIVVVGGLTRLTESGLSMVHWNLLGTLPPLNEQEWDVEFEKYKQFPEYKKKNVGMTKDEFKRIYYYEYIHRQLGRLVGATYILPAIYFAARGYFSKKGLNIMPAWRALLIGGMIGFQGLLGWYMVKSGLDENHDLMVRYNNVPRVSQYRLSSHLSTAFLIYAVMLWSALDLDKNRKLTDPLTLKNVQMLKRWAPIVTAIMFVTAASGAFVAGMDAGLVYNEFPLMGGRLIPADALALKPTILNFFENASMVQFQHRLLATVTTVGVFSLYALARRGGNFHKLPKQLRVALNSVVTVVAAQYILGITTLLTYVPTSIASTHQIGSLTLFSVLLWLTHLLKRRI